MPRNWHFGKKGLKVCLSSLSIIEYRHMPEEGVESSEKSPPEEGQEEEAKPSKTPEKEHGAEEISDKVRLGKIEENVNKLMEFFSSKDLPELVKELTQAKEGLAGFSEELGKTTESLSNLREAFKLLEKQIKEGNIKSFEELESVMDRITNGLNAKYEQAIGRQKKLDDLLEDKIKSREEINELREKNAAQLAASIAAQELASEKLRDLAEAAESAGFGMGMGAERPPDWRKTPKEEIDDWFKEKLKKMVIMKTPFAENWRMSWDLERFLASIPEEERESYLKYAGKFDRTRVEHTCHLAYDAATNVEALQGVLSNLRLSTVEVALRDKEVVEELVEFQKDAERIVRLREEKERLEAQGRNTKKLEEEISSWIRRMKGRLDGEELRINRRTLKPEFDEKPKFDEKRGLAKIEAGRMFIFLGMASGYDITELTGGDYFRSRVEHAYNRVQFRAKREGDRWWRKGKLVDWMRREIGEDKGRRITGLEVFTHKFGGGLLANVLDEKKGHLKDFGLKWHKEWVGDRFINVVKIEDKNKLTKINFENMGITRENQLSADVLDAARTADEVRAVLMAHNGYLDLPKFENYLKFSELFKHLRGKADEIGFGGRKPRGGSEKDRLMALMHKDWLRFYKGPGKATRFLGEIFTLGTLGTIRPEYRFLKPLKAVDPETGKEKFLGRSIGDSDGEILRLGKSLDSADVHGYVDNAVRTGCYSPQYAEGLLREEIKLLKVIPGVGPARAAQEIIDKIGVGGLTSGILAYIYATIAEFLGRLGKDLERTGV